MYSFRFNVFFTFKEMGVRWRWWWQWMDGLCNLKNTRVDTRRRTELYNSFKSTDGFLFVLYFWESKFCVGGGIVVFYKNTKRHGKAINSKPTRWSTHWLVNGRLVSWSSLSPNNPQPSGHFLFSLLFVLRFRFLVFFSLSTISRTCA